MTYTITIHHAPPGVKSYEDIHHTLCGYTWETRNDNHRAGDLHLVWGFFDVFRPVDCPSCLGLLAEQEG